MMGSEVRVSGDANARRRHVSFGDVTNIEVSSGATLKGTRNPADASLVPSTAAASRQGASVVAAFRKTSTPAVAPLRGTTPPPRHEGTAGAGCHTPPGRGGGGGVGGYAGDTRQAVVSSEQVSTPNRKHHPRKFLKNYFFLKNLNALPLTPERQKTQQTSAPFRRLTEREAATAPPPPTSGGAEQSAPRFVRSRCFDEVAPNSLFFVDIPPEKTKCDRNQEENRGLSTQPAAVRVVTRREAVLRAPGEPLHPPAKKLVGRELEAPPDANEEGEETGGDSAGVSTEVHKQTGEQANCSRTESSMESSSCHSETVDISAISPIHEDDVIINVDGFVPSPPPLTLLPPMDVDADAVQGEKLLAIMEPCNDAVSLLQKHLSTMESENMAGGQAGISQCLTSFAVSHCRSTNDSGYIFEQFFMRCYEEVFQAHLAVVLDEVFTAMYTQMVAIPALKMITLHGRRIICMQRDLHIRSLIELFIMTSPKGGKAGRKQNRPHTPPKKNRRLVPWQSEIGRQRRSSRNYASEEAPDGRLNVNNKIGGSNSGGRGNGQNDTTVAGAQLSSPSPSLTRRLRTYEIVKPVARRRSPKKPPTDEELMDLERLACPNQR